MSKKFKTHSTGLYFVSFSFVGWIEAFKRKYGKHSLPLTNNLSPNPHKAKPVSLARTGKIEQRIVSLNKPYIRPIVRGKEVKPVEFGAKVNKLQVNGISFIEYLSFDAFNEGTRYQQGIYLQRKLFGKCTHHSADAIYATNKNRKYATKQNIQTNFIPKGKQKHQYIEQAKQMRNILNKERSTVLEGSFGNEKNHYLLQKVKARNKNTETCWIFFGIMTANSSIIAKRMLIAQSLAKAA